MEVKGKLIETHLEVLKGNKPLEPSRPDLEFALKECTDKGEQFFQEVLSRHSEFIPRVANTHHPIWFNWILYKMRLPFGNEVDFAYLETTSTDNTIVLIEIEDPEKPMWTSGATTITRSAKFNQAIQQVENWRDRLEQNPDQKNMLFSQFRRMMGGSGLSANSFSIKYGLIYGRSSENTTQQHKNAYSAVKRSLSSNMISLYTYDQLVKQHDQNNKHGHVSFSRNVISLSEPGPVYSYLYFNEEPQSEFAYLDASSFSLDASSESILKSHKYDIDDWRKGMPLKYNGKYSTAKDLDKWLASR